MEQKIPSLIQLHPFNFGENEEIKKKSLEVMNKTGRACEALNKFDSWNEEKRERKSWKNFIVTFAENSHIFLINFFFFSYSFALSHTHTIAEQNELLIIDSVRKIFTNWISILCIHCEWKELFGLSLENDKREKKTFLFSVESHIKEANLSLNRKISIALALVN